jgi:catechol 2,3-dioxygenase-like lactoylglutathione lyase family enzyme
VPVVLDHVAIGARSIAEAVDFLAGELGGKSGYGAPEGEYRFWHWDYPNGGRIEVIEPMGPPGGFVHRFLDRQGPGIHHVTFMVPSLRGWCDRAEALGYHIVGYDDHNPGWREAFLHPKEAMGIVVQMVESASTGVGGEGPRRSEPPPEPAIAAPPVDVVGVRMRTGSPERALRQWQELLEGNCERGVDELAFAWPESGMRIAVSIEAGARDESVCIEVRADRALGLSAVPHPVLGTLFLQV